MLGWCFTVTMCGVLAAPSTEQGTITGVVVNGSAQGEVVPGDAVVLRAQNQGVLLPVMETTADEAGRFKFENLPVDGQLIFLPGANHQGIHYPGKRFRLNFAQPVAEDKITVYETVAEPCPLIAKRHEIDLRPEGGCVARDGDDRDQQSDVALLRRKIERGGYAGRHASLGNSLGL